ncbi:MAG: UbiX family flavin prenyltransferase [Planctomycetaceae bacterium]
MKRIVVAMTGASGSAYAVRLLQVLLRTDTEVHLTVSQAATQVLREELGLTVSVKDLKPESLMITNEAIEKSERLQALGFPTSDGCDTSKLHYHHCMDFNAGMASGSFLTDGMVLCPCSLGTLGAIAGGLSVNLIHRAADVHIKERRKLILVPRETPLSAIHLANMARLAEVGATVLPAMPGYYHQPNSLMDLVDFVVARICDQLGVEHSLMRRWSED